MGSERKNYPSLQFLPQQAIEEIIPVLQENSPQVFSRERIQVVGIDIPAREILDNKGNRIELENNHWLLKQGAYQVNFGFQLPTFFYEMGLEPMMFWRSSHHRCGAGGGEIFSQSVNPEFANHLLDGEVIGNYFVRNPHGIVIEKGAGIVQLCFSTHGIWYTQVSELLTPKSIRRFTGRGRIGEEKTTLPTTEEIFPSYNGWQLKERVPYLVEFNGAVYLSQAEVVIPTRHYSDLLTNPALFLYSQHSCLGDPGYSGNLGMLIVPMVNVDLPSKQGMARVAKYNVLPFGQLAEYNGQWKAESEEPYGHEIEFYFPHELGLTGFDAKSLTLEDLVRNLK